jgi:hypothetical protein
LANIANRKKKAGLRAGTVPLTSRFWYPWSLVHNRRAVPGWFRDDSNLAGENIEVKRQTLLEGLTLVSLVILGAAVRLGFQDLPNFAPVAALALFAGYFFRSWGMAVCVPLGVMAISDTFIGGYDWRMMALVYGTLAAPVALRGVLRRSLTLENRSWGGAAAATTGLVFCSLAGSVAFFVVTNFGSWLWFSMYEHTPAGLLYCYQQAIPFFRYTLTGDLVFAVALFGGYALACQAGLVRKALVVPASSAT